MRFVSPECISPILKLFPNRRSLGVQAQEMAGTAQMAFTLTSLTHASVMLKFWSDDIL